MGRAVSRRIFLDALGFSSPAAPCATDCVLGRPHVAARSAKTSMRQVQALPFPAASIRWLAEETCGV